MGQSNLDVRTIYEDAQHNIWVGYSGGIVVLNPLTMEIIRHYNTENSELQSDFIRSIAQDEKGRFWIGTFGDGLGIYTPDLQKSKRSLKGMVSAPILSTRSYKINKKNVDRNRRGIGLFPVNRRTELYDLSTERRPD